MQDSCVSYNGGKRGKFLICIILDKSGIAAEEAKMHVIVSEAPVQCTVSKNDCAHWI